MSGAYALFALFAIMDGERNVDLGLDPAESVLRQPW